MRIMVLLVFILASPILGNYHMRFGGILSCHSSALGEQYMYVDVMSPSFMW